MCAKWHDCNSFNARIWSRCDPTCQIINLPLSATLGNAQSHRKPWSPPPYHKWRDLDSKRQHLPSSSFIVSSPIFTSNIEIRLTNKSIFTWKYPIRIVVLYPPLIFSSSNSVFNESTTSSVSATLFVSTVSILERRGIWGGVAWQTKSFFCSIPRILEYIRKE